MKTWLTSRVLGRPVPNPEATQRHAPMAASTDGERHDEVILDPCCVSSCHASARYVANLGNGRNPLLLWVCEEHVRFTDAARWAMRQPRCH